MARTTRSNKKVLSLVELTADAQPVPQPSDDPKPPHKRPKASKVEKPQTKAKPSSSKPTTTQKKPATKAPAQRPVSARKAVPKYKPKEPVRAVTEKYEKPVKNIYGEDQMPIDCNQRLQQAIIFLSDEGPESYPNFKAKLKILEHELRIVWPRKKKEGDRDFQYDPVLYRKVVNMMDTQRARIESQDRLWFEQTMFPQYTPSVSEASYKYPPSPTEPKAFRDMMAEVDAGRAVAERPAAGRAAKPTKAQVPAPADSGDDDGSDGIEDENDTSEGVIMTEEEYQTWVKDPWYEELPAPEVWHRKMANRFPFGDTPFGVEYMSNEIKRDLGEAEKVSTLTWLSNLFGELVTTCSGVPPGTQPQMWDLPAISDAELVQFANGTEHWEDRESRRQALKRQASTAPTTGRVQSKKARHATGTRPPRHG